nr:MAG: putative capsid protein [Picobirnavirus sp.]
MARNTKTCKSNSSKTNKKRNYNRSKNQKGEIENLRSDEDTSRSGNDPSWYASNPVLLRDAASYPFSYVTGASSIHDPGLWIPNYFESGAIEQVPGIASLHVYPTIGTSINATDPINVASQSVYSFVRHANSGHSNYDPADLMMYILAMANMYSFLVWCQRLYGYALTYDQRNRYIPQDLIRANNVDADDLRTNLANFRFWINTLIAKMVSFAVPATMSVFSRMSFMYSDYYIEGTSIKEQLYQFVPDGFYQFGLDPEKMYGILEWKPFDWSTVMKVSDVMNYGDTMFDAIWSQEDFGIMSGDILKAYGDNIIKLSQIPEAYSMIPKFDAMVLTQIKNAEPIRITPKRIAQVPEDGIIGQVLTAAPFKQGELFYGTSGSGMTAEQATTFNNGLMAYLKDDHILTVDMDQPTPEVVIEATRLKVAYDQHKAELKCATEVITRVVVTDRPGHDVELPPIMTGLLNTTTDAAGVEAVHTAIEVARNFHYMPKLWLLNLNSTSKKLSAKCMFDVDNFTVLDDYDLTKLHEAATINMFAVPSIGKV